MTDFEKGLLLGILIGEAHFGGDGKKAQVTLKMHVRHDRIFDWLVRLFPNSKLYGPYNHAGRNYYQWMMRGEALRNELIPLLDSLPWHMVDEHSYERYVNMKQRYRLSAEYAAD